MNVAGALGREAQLGASAPPARVVAIGDLNGSARALESILSGLELVGRSGQWTGGATRLVQVGDIFNRGDGARQALERLLGLRAAARRAGGDVIVLLGNHEVMVGLGNEAYCTVGEYLSFASAAQRAAWPGRVRRTLRRLLREHAPRSPVPPCEPRLLAWMAENAPGRAEMRRALGPRGRLGRVLRALPVAARIGDAVFVHAGVTPRWARLGVDGLNRVAVEAWREAPRFYADVPRRSLLRAPRGPLWLRDLARGVGRETEAMLAASLALLGARRLVVGHSQTRGIQGGEAGRIHTRFRSRLVCIDVGLSDSPDSPLAALVIDGRRGLEWTPDGLRDLWLDATVAAPRCA